MIALHRQHDELLPSLKSWSREQAYLKGSFCFGRFPLHYQFGWQVAAGSQEVTASCKDTG